MARGVNKVILIGNLGADPEIRALPSGVTVANIRIATSETWKDKQSGEQKERTEWHNVVAFDRLGEIMGEYLKKGSKVYIEGSLQTRKWQDKQGNDRYTTEIKATEMQMLDGKPAGEEQERSSRGRGRGRQQQSYGGEDDGGQSGQREEQQDTGGEFDDDIPF